MSKVCDVCGKSPSTGYALERRGMAKKKGGVGQKITGKTKRRFLPNLQRVRIQDGRKTRHATVCTRCIKSGRITKVG
jgi:large subunit ribosomal protein L28